MGEARELLLESGRISRTVAGDARKILSEIDDGARVNSRDLGINDDGNKVPDPILNDPPLREDF